MDNPLSGASHRGRTVVRHGFALSCFLITAWVRRLALPRFEAFSAALGPWETALSPIPVETSATALRRAGATATRR